MVGLTVFMGHGSPTIRCAARIGKRLGGNRFASPSERTEELYAKATLYMKQVLAERAKG